MKPGHIGPDEVFHRVLTPRWAFAPTSGAGAALNGGRFNRPGVEALHLSRAPQTALEEYRQGASITPPGTLAAYRVTLTSVADLSGGYDPAMWAVAWADWACDWQYVARIQGETPISWMLAERVMGAGRCGLLYPSVRHPGGVNLVVFPSALKAADSVVAHDPDRRLPRDPSSWTLAP